jgi:Tfp pilus assembly protein PilX
MNAIRDNNGLTLVEVLISLVVTMILFLALMQTTLLSISQNSKNSLRDEAVSVATERMREATSMVFNLMVSDPNGLPAECAFMAARCTGGRGLLVDRNVRNIPGPGGDVNLFDYCTCRIVPPQVAGVTDFKQVNIFVGWEWNGEEYSHAISSIVRR